MISFLDTSSLLEMTQQQYRDHYVVISTTVLSELEELKNHPVTGYKARRAIKYIQDNPPEDIWIFNNSMLQPIIEKDLPINNDMKILAAAIDYERTEQPDNVQFYTNDISLKNIANLFFGSADIKSIQQPQDDYKGYKEVRLTDIDMGMLYQEPDFNRYNLLVNEYLIVRNADNTVVDLLVWTGEQYRKVLYNEFDSMHFGKIKPFKDDPYQQLAYDSLVNNKISLIKGKAGSGKSLAALSYLFELLEHHKIDKILVFCNTVAAKGAAKLGFLPGDRTEKLMDSQIGNFLNSKIGDRTEVERLIQEEKLILLPVADIRGYDTTGMRAGIYVTEAQNLSVSLMKLILQRVGEDCFIILDGDMDCQVDLDEFEGRNNGMRRVSEVFRGQDFYGEVELQIIHRGKIAARADLM